MRKEETIEAYLDAYGQISVYIHEHFYQGRSETFRLAGPGPAFRSLSVLGVTRSGTSYIKYLLKAPEDLAIGGEYYVVADYGLRAVLRFGYIVRTARFDREFSYDGPLGVAYQTAYSDFALWAPTASAVKLELIHASGSASYPLERGERGVWRQRIAGNLAGTAYLYLVKVNGAWTEAVDPYARSAYANKRYGAIVPGGPAPDDRSALPPLHSPCDAVIYEASVRDFTKQFAMPEAGRFLGMAKAGLKTPGGLAAGLDHLRELGVTHLQLMPVADFTSVDEEHVDAYYNWGYDPGHFNVPEGSYASDPDDPAARTREFRELVAALHAKGIRVIMDVVYNHLYDRLGSDYEKIVPNYYFRLSDQGAPSNGSYCGNDFDSTRPMARKAILDSLAHWLADYDVDGFRFDLMGILDVRTMQEAEALIHRAKPDALVYGEGWNMPTLLDDQDKAMAGNQARLPRVDFFNDYFRDQVKGSTDQLGARGYATGDLAFAGALPACLTGCCGAADGEQRYGAASQSLNYVECHDGATVWDKLKIADAGTDTASRVARQKLMIALVLLSEGVPFLQSGQEFCRSKQGVANSYAAGDRVNMIDWARKDKYAEVADYARQLIALRRKEPAFRLSDPAVIREKVRVDIGDNGLIIAQYQGIGSLGGSQELAVLINPAGQPAPVELDGEYRQLLGGGTAAGHFVCAPLSVTVLGR